MYGPADGFEAPQKTDHDLFHSGRKDIRGRPELRLNEEHTLMQDTVVDMTETRKTFTTKANVTNKYLADMPDDLLAHSIEKPMGKQRSGGNKTTHADKKKGSHFKASKDSLLPALNVNRDHPAIVASRERMRYEKYMEHGSQTLK